MEKFVVTGSLVRDTHRNFELKLPEAKCFASDDTYDGNTEVDHKRVVEWAVRKSSQPLRNQVQHSYLVSFMVDLQKLFQRHPFPINQGPVIIPFECEGEWKNGHKVNVREPKEVMEQRTVFHHDDLQPCVSWYPLVSGIDAWKQKNNIIPTYRVEELRHGIQGPASLRDMSIVYSCNHLGCQLHCPCSICNDKTDNCRMECKTESCQNCRSQCNEHIIKLPRLFDVEVDNYTLITQRLGELQIGIPHAGIPLSCVTCTNDLLEHQSLHLVFHTRCRFCIHQMRSFTVLSGGVKNVEDFKQANRILRWSEARTCSYCLSKHQDAYARIKHEKNVHEGKERHFLCKHCNKSFTNQNALDYHVQKHGLENAKETCEVCGYQSSNKGHMKEHKELLHKESVGSGLQFKCRFCEKTYKVQKCLNRHLREKHSGGNKNVDYIEDLGSIGDMKCEHCNRIFKRNFCLERHVNTVHAQETSFLCTICDMKFTRKDSLNKHVKMLHANGL